jgi:hypothetical protein
MKPVMKKFAGDWQSSSHYRYDERSGKHGLMLADALFGQKYPIHPLVLLQELAWHISVSQVVHHPTTMLKNLRHTQDIISLAYTQQRDVADAIQIEVTRLAVQELGYDDWDSLRADYPKSGYLSWELLSQALERAYSVLTPLAKRFQAENGTLQDDFATAVSKGACYMRLRTWRWSHPEARRTNIWRLHVRQSLPGMLGN